MKIGTTLTGQAALAILLGFSLAGCASLGGRSEIVPAEPQVRIKETYLSEATAKFGDLLQAYPSRRPYTYDAPPVIEVGPITNSSGESGLPDDFSTVLITILGEIGEAIAPKSTKTLRERETDPYNQDPRTGPPADLTIRGSITEAERQRTKEFSVQMDLLFEDRNGDRGPGRNSVDSGVERGKEQEVWTLTLDLRLEDRSGLVVETVSQTVEVGRHARSSSYGVFWRGSGVGSRTRSTVAQSRSHALRIAAQQSILMLLGRHLRIAYWRAVPGSEPDDKLVKSYRSVLANGEASDDFRSLLCAHGVKLSESYVLTESERRAASELQVKLGLPAETSDVDLAIELWKTVPYEGEAPPLRVLRRLLRQERRIAIESLARMIASLKPGQPLQLSLYFDFESAEVTEAAKEQIARFSEAMRLSGRYEGPDWWIELVGHSDSRGERGRNQALSEQRAVQVRTYLDHRLAPPVQRVASRGRGSTAPAVKNAKSEQDHALNRRVEILLVFGNRPGASPRSPAKPPRARSRP